MNSLSVIEAAKRLKVHPAVLHMMIHDGRLRAYKLIQGSLRVSATDVERLQQEARVVSS